ncbi:hypothetical protein GF376_02295 [Candidatus Peregrinibacteria bacterium]|nr:hypothetical protein [Candidatus Peregrinibacteria bacterium]
MNYDHDNPLIKGLHLIKYRGLIEIADPLSKIIEQKIDIDTIFCPVPISNQKFKQRGFNQTEILLKNYQTASLLKRTKQISNQQELSFLRRRENVKNCFEITTESIPREVVLFDDIATTLSTLNECAKVLKQNGAKKVKAIALARQTLKS